MSELRDSGESLTWTCPRRGQIECGNDNLLTDRECRDCQHPRPEED